MSAEMTNDRSPSARGPLSSPAAVARGPAVASPALLARIAGVYYLLIFIFGPSGAATATPLRMAVTMACDTAVAIVFYTLFKPVSRSLSAAALLFRLLFVAAMTLGSLDYFGALDLFHSAHSAHAFNAVYMSALALFGAHCLLLGSLVYRSEFLPGFLGILLALAGLAYVTFAAPSLVRHVYPYILIPGALGEGLLTLWLLTAGVNGERWVEQACLSARIPDSTHPRGGSPN
jgi:hypothetical protein